MAIINTLRNAGSDMQWLRRLTGDYDGRIGDGSYFPEAYPFRQGMTNLDSVSKIIRFGDGTSLTSFHDSTPNDTSSSVTGNMGYWFNDEDGVTKVGDDMYSVDVGFKVGDNYIISSTFEYDGSTQGEGTSRYVPHEDGYIRYFDRATKTLHKIEASGTTGRVTSIYVHGNECWITLQKSAFDRENWEFGYIDLADWTYHKAFAINDAVKYVAMVTDTTVFYITWQTISEDETNWYMEYHVGRSGGTPEQLVENVAGHGYNEREQEWANLYNNDRYYIFSTMDRLYRWDDNNKSIQSSGEGTNGSTTQLTKFIYSDDTCAIVRGGVASSYDVYALSFTTGNMIRIIDTKYADPFDKHCVYVENGRIFITSALTGGNGVWYYNPAEDDVVAANDLIVSSADSSLWLNMGGNYGAPIRYGTTLNFIPNERKNAQFVTNSVTGTSVSYLVTFDETTNTFAVPGYENEDARWQCFHGYQNPDYPARLVLLTCGTYENITSSWGKNEYADVVTFLMNTGKISTTVIKSDIFKANVASKYCACMKPEPDNTRIFFDMGTYYAELDTGASGKPFYVLQRHEGSGETYVYGDIVIHIPITNRDTEIYTGYAYVYELTSRRVIKLDKYQVMLYFSNNYGYKPTINTAI